MPNGANADLKKTKFSWKMIDSVLNHVYTESEKKKKMKKKILMAVDKRN